MKTLLVMAFISISFLAIEMIPRVQVVGAPVEYLSGRDKRRNRRKNKKA
jgi:hypothetical protein